MEYQSTPPVAQVRSTPVDKNTVKWDKNTYQDLQTKILNLTTPSLSKELKEFKVISMDGEYKFVDWLHLRAKIGKINVESSIDGLLKSDSAPQDTKLWEEIKTYRKTFEGAIQVASNKISSESIRELQIWGLVNDGCMVTGDGRPDWDNNIAKHFVGETFATTDRGNSVLDDSRTTMTNYTGLLGLCKNQPTFKLGKDEEIRMSNGGMYILNTITGVLVRKILLPSTQSLELPKITAILKS